MPTIDQYKQWLEEAEAAQHSILTGKQTVRVEYNGRMVIYNNTEQSAQQLANHIADLKIKVNGRRSRAINVIF